MSEYELPLADGAASAATAVTPAGTDLHTSLALKKNLFLTFYLHVLFSSTNTTSKN